MAGKRFTVRIPPFARPVLSDGKAQIERRFEDVAVGEAWESKVRSQIKALKAGAQAQAIGIERRRDISFTAAHGLWLAQKRNRPRTIKWYGEVLRRLDKHLGRLKVSQIGKTTLADFLDTRYGATPAASKDAIHKDLTVLRDVLKWARMMGYQTDMTAWEIKKPRYKRKVRREYNPEVLETFLAAACGRDSAIIEVAAGTGFRSGEIRAFDCSWIRWDHDHIRLPSDEEFTPKDDDPREVPLHGRLRNVLEDWLGDRRRGLVFPPLRTGASGTGVARGAGLRGIFARVRAASGVRWTGWHDLRHHYLSLLATLGVPPPDLLKISGHSSLETLQKYLHASLDHLKKAQQKLDEALGAGRTAGSPPPAEEKEPPPDTPENGS